MRTRTTGSVDIEWLLVHSFRVHRLDECIAVPFDHVTVFAFATEFREHDVVVFQANVARDLPPSQALYRWVATKGALALGSLFALPTDDGTVDVEFRHTVHAEGLNSVVASEIVQCISDTTYNLGRDIRDLFT